MRAFVLFTMIAVFVLHGTMARGNYGAYLFIEGIEGESQTKEREGWIEISSVSHGIAREGDGRESGAEFSGITIAKQLDKATPLLKEACAAGRIFPAAVIDFVRQTAGTTQFYRVRLEDISIYKVKLSGRTDPERVPETIALQYRFIEWEYTEFETTGDPMAEHRAWWDRAGETGGYETGPINGTTPPPDPETFRRSVRFTRLDGDGAQALLTWDSREGKSYGVYYSPDLHDSFDTLVEIVPSDGDGTTAIIIDLGGTRGFYIVRELD